MLQAFLNGGRTKAENPAVPAGAHELAADAALARAAGADELHVHPRRADGDESLEPDDVGTAVAAIRVAAPGMPTGVSTGVWIAPEGNARLDAIAAWTELPDYASVNLNEDDAPQVMDILLSKGIGIEAGIWNRKDAERFVVLPQARRCLRILIEMPEDPEGAMRDYREVRHVLDRAAIDLPILLHGQDASTWPMVRQAARDGLSTRIGFEDVLTLPDGNPALSNATLVGAAIGMSG